ncbi:MAG: DNA-binding domain-containing protein [Chlamydiota bacterium]|jgi:hypothetical protein
MYLLDPKVPANLLKLQSWFGKAISDDTEGWDELNLPVLKAKYKDTAQQYVKPGKYLTSAQRVAIYNEQYWLRLVSCLKNDFPLLVRLFGEKDFEHKIARRYLEKYPPSSWSLYILGENMAKWVEDHYPNEMEKPFILEASKVDYGYMLSFFSAEYPSVQNLELTTKISLQPHAHLFNLPFDIFTFRQEVLQNSENFYLDNNFPELEKGNFYYILFRWEKKVVYKSLFKREYETLQLLEKPIAFQDFIEKINIASFDLQSFFEKWSKLKILT